MHKASILFFPHILLMLPFSLNEKPATVGQVRKQDILPNTYLIEYIAYLLIHLKILIILHSDPCKIHTLYFFSKLMLFFFKIVFCPKI